MSTEPRLEPLLAPGEHSRGAARRLSATGTVRARIMLAVELGLLRPGERLPPLPELAAGLDVSEITARRALEQLVDDGVLTRRRGRQGGTFVAEKLSITEDHAVRTYLAAADEVRRLIDQRMLMESAVVHAAVMHGSDAELGAIRAHVDAGASATSWATFHAADRAFHLAVAEAAHLDAAARYVEVLDELHRFFVPYPLEHLHQSNAEHTAILDAALARDVDAAVLATREHVLSLHRDMFMNLISDEGGAPPTGSPSPQPPRAQP